MQLSQQFWHTVDAWVAREGGVYDTLQQKPEGSE